MKKVAVIVPFYKSSLTAYEKIALQQCKAILYNHPIVAIKPKSLTLPADAAIINYADVVSFNDGYFAGIAGYNKLMLSADFYGEFLNYEFILIYQLDAFVFKDELAYWCGLQLDYIGSPWIRMARDESFLKQALLTMQRLVSVKLNLKKRGVPNKYQFENKVGNGGFSLRRVAKFYAICLAMQKEINHYLSHSAHQYNEDAFWSLEANRKSKNLNIPEWQTGLKFAFELHPDSAFALNCRQLPFGCHDWDRYADFWRPILKNYNYDI